MKLGKLPILGFILAIFIGQLLLVGNQMDFRSADSLYDEDGEGIPEIQNAINPDSLNTFDTHSLAGDTASGILDSVLAEQAGWYDTGGISARTDAQINDFTDIPIDNASTWVASNAKMDLWNLNREYAENGTFDDGVSGNTTYPATPAAYPYGWDLDQYDSSGNLQTLMTYYDDTDDYVTVENQGEEDTSPSLTYWHYDYTWNLWNQTITNQPYSDNLTLSFSYNYVSGIVNNLYAVGGDVGLAAWIENSTYNAGYWLVDLMYETPGRDTWYDVTIYNITDAPAEFTFSIGLLILADDGNSFELNPGGDYDDDGAIDGDNARVFKVQIDDVSLVSQTPPTPEEVDLHFHAGNYNTTITGSVENYTSVIENEYWDSSSLSVGVSANVSVSFDYEVWLLQHFFSNSSYSTHPTEKGVTYSIDIGQSADLSTFTYIGSDLTSTFENFSVYIYIPQDWDNATVYDPFTNDVTSSCSLQTGIITIPTSLLTRLGWWEIDFESPNYAKDIVTQRYDTGLDEWSNETLFRSGNITRTQVEIGTESSTAIISSPANITWILPNSTIWAEESVSNSTGDLANSSAWNLGGTNTTAGQWEIGVLWSNGTEVGYDSTNFDMYHTANLIALDTDIETDAGLVVTSFLQYTDMDNGEYLMEDAATIVANWSSTQVVFAADLLTNRWTANFDTSIIDAGHYVVRVNASRPYFDDVSCQFNITSTFVTNGEILDVSDSPIQVNLNEENTFVFRYELDNTTGITGATIQTDYSGPENGLSFAVDGSSNDGNYSISVLSLKSGTFSISISGSKEFHYQGSDSFTLIVPEERTELLRLNGSADFVHVGSDYRLVVQYVNSSGYGLVGANVSIVEVAPATGLAYGGFASLGNGSYAILLTPSESKTFTLFIKANLSNHITQITTFAFTVTEISTDLSLNVSIATISVSDQLLVLASFTDDEFNGIESATISVVNPPTGLDFTITELADGNYSIIVNPSLAGSYLITILGAKTKYQDVLSSFSIIVEELDTSLEIVNGMSDVILYGQEYEIVLNYLNASGYGIPSANVSVVSTNPLSGLQANPAVDLGNGSYRVVLVPTLAITFTIVLQCNLTNHNTQYVTFTLTVSSIPSVLIIDYSGATISVDMQYTVQLLFQDDSGNDLEGAIISVLNSLEGLTFGGVDDLSGGLYNITILPDSVGTYQIAFKASLSNYHNSTVGFTLIVTRVPTTLSIVGDVSSDSTLFSEDYVISLIYKRTDTNANITVAHLNVSTTPSEGLEFSIIEIGEFYQITFKANNIGIWRIFITANKAGHITGLAEFELEVVQISTTINEYSLLDSFLFGRSYNMTFNYLMLNQTGIVEAEVTPSGSGAQFVSIEELGNGQYLVTVIPEALGYYEIVLTFTMDGFDSKTSALAFTVVPVPIEILDIQGLTGTEEQLSTLSLRLVESDTGYPVTGAIVEYQIITGTDLGEIRQLEETEPGVYSVGIVMPSSDANATIKIYVNIENYDLNVDIYEADLTATVSEAAVVLRAVSTISPFLVIVGFAIVGMLARRVYIRKEREKNIEALLVKRRFEDVRGLLGVFVIHKHSGIPIYSKVIKGGLNEDLISGFISAITQFRSGFEMDQDNWVVVPISDIIRSVSTENLLCAFITLTTPSKSQELKMIDFSEAVGFVFDKLYTEPPVMIIDDETSAQFNSLLDEHLDGQFLRKHIITELSQLPSSPRCIGDRLEGLSHVGAFELSELAAEMTACGIDESRAYKIIWDAIENKTIVIAEVDNDVVEIIDISDSELDSEIDNEEAEIVDVSDSEIDENLE